MRGRGPTKRGQFAMTLWFPDGSRYEVRSRKNLTVQEWREKAGEHLDRLRSAVQAYRLPSSEPQNT